MLVSFYLSMELQCEFLMSDIALILLIQHQKYSKFYSSLRLNTLSRFRSKFEPAGMVRQTWRLTNMQIVEQDIYANECMNKCFCEMQKYRQSLNKTRTKS